MQVNEFIATIKRYRKVYKNYFSLLAKMYLKRGESQKHNITFKVKLKDGRELELPYGLINTYAVASSIGNPNIKNINVDENILSFQFYDKPVFLDPSRSCY